MKKNQLIKVVTGLVRFENVNLYEPFSSVGDKKYSIALVIAKHEAETVGKIKAAYAQLKNESQALVSKKGWMPESLRDGDKEKSDDVYKGAYFLTATSLAKPGIVDKDLNPLINVGDIYSGCYGRASITLFTYEFNGKLGIGVGLNNIQKLRDGKKPAPSGPQIDFG